MVLAALFLYLFLIICIQDESSIELPTKSDKKSSHTADFKGFFEIILKWMLHRPHDRQYRREMEGVLLIRKLTFGLAAPKYLFVARFVAVSIQSVTHTVHSLGVKRDCTRTKHPGHLRCC